MMDLYAENILDHYRHPRRKQLLESPSIEHEEVNHACGDTVTLQLSLEDGTLKEVGWTGTGCAISQACMSMLTEEMDGKNIEDMEKITKSEMLEFLGVPIGPRRIKCALLALHTLKNALRKNRGENLQSWLETVG